MPRTKKTADTETANYGELRRQLDEIMTKLQDPECDVDEAAALYEQALQAIGRLETHLQAAENRVRRAHGDFAGGQGA